MSTEERLAAHAAAFERGGYPCDGGTGIATDLASLGAWARDATALMKQAASEITALRATVEADVAAIDAAARELERQRLDILQGKHT